MKNNLFLTLVFLSLFSLSACKELNGTDVDNPFQGGLQEPCQSKGRCIPTPYVQIQMRVICSKVNQCLGLADNDPAVTCQNLLPDQNGVDAFISTPAKNYLELNQLYHQKKLKINPGNWNECLGAIQHLECNDPIFTNALNVNDSQNFANIHNVLVASEMCLNIYSLKAE
ncbi:MAG: hypothetical protein V4654_02310 [Bdellovibrionota bacterium]